MKLKVLYTFCPLFLCLRTKFYQKMLIVLCLFLTGLGYSQNYTTTGASTNWHDAAAWKCTGGPCNSNPFPNNNVSGSTITVSHNITYNSNSPINLNSRAVLVINNTAKLTLTSNLNINTGGSLNINSGEINIGPGVLNNKGTMFLNRAILTKNGNVVNDSAIQMTTSCFIITSGNFVNNGSITGDGSVKVETGNINNYRTWSPLVEYYYANNSTGLPNAPLTAAEIDEKCNCITTNCDILPGYLPVNKVFGLLDHALVSLAGNYEAGTNPNPLIYTIDNSDKVLVEMIINLNKYNEALTYINGFNVTNNDFISDFYNAADDQKIITIFFPIVDLLKLSDRGDLFNKVYVVYKPISNEGLITSQGDGAQKSDLARLGWNVTGKDVKVGVISDSYDRRSGIVNTNSAAVLTDISNGDLPGGENSVTVLHDYPFGVATDEGRAMLQIVHDVAPEAQLFFRTGSVSEGNLAAGIAELVAAGCNVIVDDLTYIKAPFYRDGFVAKAIDDVTSKANVQYFTSAGNFASNSYEANFNPVAGTNRHDFGGGKSSQALTLGVGQYVLALQWEDEFYSLGSQTGASTDLDIYLANAQGAIQYGFNNANLGSDPVEIMPFTVINPTQTNIVIERAHGNSSLKFKYVVFRAGDDGQFTAVPALTGSTVVGHSNAEGAITVGAVRYDNINPPTAQSSSSRGGTGVNGVLRQKPNIMAPTGGDTSVNLGSPDYDNNGLPNFFGTSASAPHAAAVAALLIEAKTKFGVDLANPNLSIRNLLSNNAIDMSTPGFDLVSGAGFISATEAIASFANPTPIISSIEIPDGVVPGEVSFELTLKGQFFDNEATVLLRDVELETTFVDATTLTATIPVFIGNPNITVNNPANTPITNGVDGGDSNAVTFFDPIIVDVKITAEQKERRYGESNPEFTYSVALAETGESLTESELELLAPSITLTTEALSNSMVGIYSIEVNIGDVDPILLEVYKFVPVQGVLLINPMPVTIEVVPFGPLRLGAPIPELTYTYKFGDPNENVIVDPLVAQEFKSHHLSSLATFNGISMVNGISLINGISFVNGQPYINGIPLTNTTFFVSDNTIAQSSTVVENGFSLVNGDGSEKLVQFGSDLFSDSSIENGTFSSLTNGISMINGLSLVNGTAKLNGINLVNGLSMVNGISFVNGLSFVNGVSLINGFSYVNGLSLVNTDTEEDPLANLFASTYIILSQADLDLTDGEFIGIKPVTMFTGFAVGNNAVCPAGLFDTNFIVNTKPYVYEVIADNPIVGCNERIKASGICKLPATLAGHPRITTLLRFEYTNSLNVPLYINLGPDNKLKGNAYYVNKPPSVFLPGVHTFDVYTDGGTLQWEIKTADCSQASKSPNGSNANPCVELATTTSSLRLAQEGPYNLYPNPVKEQLNIRLNQAGPVAYRVFNELGMVLLEDNLKTNDKRIISIDVSRLNQGLLFVEINSTSESRVFKVIKQ